MLRKTKTDPEKQPHITYECTRCFTPRQFQLSHFMDARMTKRGDRYGARLRYAYACPKCGQLCVVEYWKPNPQLRLPF